MGTALTTAGSCWPVADAFEDRQHPPTGWLALQLGWSGYFLFCAAAAIPGLLLLRRFEHWGMPAEEAADTLPS